MNFSMINCEKHPRIKLNGARIKYKSSECLEIVNTSQKIDHTAVLNHCQPQVTFGFCLKLEQLKMMFSFNAPHLLLDDINITKSKHGPIKNFI